MVLVVQLVLGSSGNTRTSAALRLSLDIEKTIEEVAYTHQNPFENTGATGEKAPTTLITFWILEQTGGNLTDYTVIRYDYCDLGTGNPVTDHAAVGINPNYGNGQITTNGAITYGDNNEFEYDKQNGSKI